VHFRCGADEIVGKIKNETGLFPFLVLGAHISYAEIRYLNFSGGFLPAGLDTDCLNCILKRGFP